MIFIALLGVLLIVICYISRITISNKDTDWAVLQQSFLYYSDAPSRILNPSFICTSPSFIQSDINKPSFLLKKKINNLIN